MNGCNIQWGAVSEFKIQYSNWALGEYSFSHGSNEKPFHLLLTWWYDIDIVCCTWWHNVCSSVKIFLNSMNKQEREFTFNESVSQMLVKMSWYCYWRKKCEIDCLRRLSNIRYYWVQNTVNRRWTNEEIFRHSIYQNTIVKLFLFMKLICVKLSYWVIS